MSSNLALFALFFSPMAFAQGQLPAGHAPISPGNEAAIVVAKELIGLMADRLDVAEKTARFKWNEKLLNKTNDAAALDDDKVNATINEPNGTVIKESGVEAGIAEAFVKAQVNAFKDHQAQRFASWTKEGVYEFDDEPETMAVLKTQLEKNLREQLEKVAKLRAIGCDSVLADQINELAANIFVRRGIDKALAKPLLEPIRTCATTASR